MINSGENFSEENMRLDEKFFEKLLPSDLPVLHFYDFKGPSATYGIFINPEIFLKKGHGLHLAKRPTGGGILFHLWDLTFSVLIPKNHPGYSNDVMQNYKFINDLVRLALSEYLGVSLDLLSESPVPLNEVSGHFCFAKPTKYDVMIEGFKIAGAAQRRKKNGFLHQGSISIGLPDFNFLQKTLIEGALVTEAMQKYTFILTQGDVDEAKEKLRTILQKVICF